MTSAYLCAQLIVVEAILKPQNCPKAKQGPSFSNMSSKDPNQLEDENYPPDTGGGEPGIEFLKGVATDSATSGSEGHRLPLIHNLPGATTFYNSYKNVFQSWKNSTPKLVQYSASELEVVVYRKNGQVDTLRGGATPNEVKDEKLDIEAERRPSLEGVLAAGLKQLEMDGKSSSPTPASGHMMFQSSSSSAPPTPPPGSPFPPSEFRFIYNQGSHESLKNNNGQALPVPDEGGMKSKLIPDLGGIVSELLKNPEGDAEGEPGRVNPQPLTIEEALQNNLRQEYEACAAMDTQELLNALNRPRKVPLLTLGEGARHPNGKNCHFMYYGSRLSVDDYMKARQAIPPAKDERDLMNQSFETDSGTITCEEQTPCQYCHCQCAKNVRGEIISQELTTSEGSMQTDPFESIAAWTQTVREEPAPKPEYEDFSCQVEPKSAAVQDNSVQCKPENAEFSCQMGTAPAILQDGFVQCKPDNAEFSCQVEINPASPKTDNCVQCKPEDAEFSCQVELLPVVGEDVYVQCKPECHSKMVQTPEFCCEESKKKLQENKIQMEKIMKMAELQVKKWKNDAAAHEISEEKVYSTIQKFLGSQRSSKDTMNELTKEVDNLKEVVQQSSNSFGLPDQESSEYFEDVWLSSDGKDEATTGDSP